MISFLISAHYTLPVCLESYDETKAGALFARFVRNGPWQCATLTAIVAFTHTKAELDRALEVFQKVGRKLGILAA